jgi:hypothetical protein
MMMIPLLESQSRDESKRTVNRISRHEMHPHPNYSMIQNATLNPATNAASLKLEKEMGRCMKNKPTASTSSSPSPQ